MDLMNLLLFVGLYGLTAVVAFGAVMWALVGLNNIPDQFPKKARAHKERAIILRSSPLLAVACAALVFAFDINPIL